MKFDRAEYIEAIHSLRTKEILQDHIKRERNCYTEEGKLQYK